MEERHEVEELLDWLEGGGVTRWEVWFTDNGANKIGRITTDGVITEFPIPTAGSVPVGIIVGPDGALWFTEPGVNQIGRITTAGAAGI